MIKNTKVSAIVEHYKKTGTLLREGDGEEAPGVISPETAQDVVSILDDAGALVQEAYGRLEQEVSPLAMESNDSVKMAMESVKSMMDDIDQAKSAVTQMGGQTNLPEADEDDEDELEEEDGEDFGGDPAAMQEPTPMQFSVQGVSDSQGFTNELSDLLAKYNGVMKVNEEDMVISTSTEPRAGDQPDDAEAEKDITAHMQIEGKYRKFKVTEGMVALMKHNVIGTKKKYKMNFESLSKPKGKRKR